MRDSLALRISACATLVKDLRASIPIVSGAWVDATSPYCRPEDRMRLVEGLTQAGID